VKDTPGVAIDGLCGVVVEGDQLAQAQVAGQGAASLEMPS